MALDEAGAGPGCAVLNQEADLIVGRDEAFYFTSLEGRGPCFACEGIPVCGLGTVHCAAIAAHHVRFQASNLRSSKSALRCGC